MTSMRQHNRFYNTLIAAIFLCYGIGMCTQGNSAPANVNNHAAKVQKNAAKPRLRPFFVRWVSGNITIETYMGNTLISSKPLPHNNDTRIYPGQQIVSGANGKAELNIGMSSFKITPNQRYRIYNNQVDIELAGAARGNPKTVFLSPQPGSEWRAKDFKVSWSKPFGIDAENKINLSIYAEGNDTPVYTLDNISAPNGTIDLNGCRKALANYKGKKPAKMLVVLFGSDGLYHITWFTLVD